MGKDYAILLSCSVVSDSLWPHELYPAKFLCPRNPPGKNSAVGYHFLLQGILLNQGSNHCLLCLLNWQTVSLPLSYLGSPWSILVYKIDRLWLLLILLNNFLSDISASHILYTIDRLYVSISRILRQHKNYEFNKQLTLSSKEKICFSRIFFFLKSKYLMK